MWFTSSTTTRRLSSERAMKYAAGAGHLSVVEWLHANNRPIYSEIFLIITREALDYAAAGGHVKVME